MRTTTTNHSTTIIRKNFQEIKRTASSNRPNLIENSEFIRLFKISSDTSRAWRNKKFLPFIRISSKVYFRLEDIEQFLESHTLFTNPAQKQRP